MRHRILAGLALLLVCLLGNATRALADSSQTSVMQDDQQLVDSGAPAMFSALTRMEALGVQTVRVNVEWNTVAPDPNATTLPVGDEPDRSEHLSDQQ